MRKRMILTLTKAALVVPLATLLCGALFGGHSAYALEAPTITLSISSALVTNDNSTLVPTAASGNSSHYYIPVTIETTNADTYSVNISSSSANLTAAGTSFVIAPANNEGQTLANLTNQWGFRSKVFSTQPADPDAEFGSTVYKPVTTAGQSIVADEPANASQVLMLDFGAGVTSAADSGNYTATVTLAAVATPMIIAGTFQEFTPEQCNGLSAGETVSLADSRDNKTYRVTKMEDGNCWMSQNLAISPDASNSITTWDYNAKTTGTVSGIPASTDTFSTTADGVKNWHQGSHIDATNSNLTGASIDNKNTNTGNYYSWYLAIGQNDGSGSTADTDVTTSICPAGWRLPSTSMYNALAKAYNPSNDPTSWDATILSTDSTFGATTFGTHFGITSVDSLPGYYSPSFGGAGTNGVYWASTISNASIARDFRSYSSNGVIAQDNNIKYAGYSIRCVYDMPTFQDFSASDYNSLAAGATTALKDTRDGKLYLVTKMADGNVWMTQNLSLGSKTESITLTPADSNVTSDWTLPAGITSFQSSNQNYAEVYVGTHQNATYNTGGYADAGVTCNDAGNCDGTNSGNYYSWFAATAQGDGTTNATDPAIGYADSATTSICPKGWSLPTSGDSNSDFQKLYDAYGNYTSFKNAWWPENQSQYTGFLDTATINGTTSYSRWWSSTVNSANNSYRLRMDTSDVNPQNDSGRRFGLPVRCVYKPTIEDATSMQDLTATMCSNTAVGTTAALTDSRDGKTYRVTKMEDGNCWMSQNLAIEGGTTLTAATSDVSSNYTLPASSTSGFSDDTAQYMYNGSHTDGTADSSTNTGGYYSFLTATANTGTGDSGDATGSICPKGWKLPTTTQYNTLATSYGGTGGSSWDADLMKTGSDFGQTTFGTHFGVTSASALVGNYGNSGLNSSGLYSAYWSSSINSSTNGYNFDLASSAGFRAQVSSGKRGGASVRCVLLGQ